MTKYAVGDEVAVGHSWDTPYQYRTVAKLTPTLIVLDNGQRFFNNGKQYGGNAYLVDATSARQQEGGQR